MKKVLFIVVASLVLFACNENEEIANITVPGVEPQMSAEEIEKAKQENIAFYENEMYKEFGNHFSYSSNSSVDGKELALKLHAENQQDVLTLKSGGVPVVYGPYSVDMNSTRVLTDVRLFVSQPGLASAYYFCDIYEYRYQTTLLSGAVGYVDFVDPEGFESYVSQTIGYTAHLSGSSVYTVNTFKIHVKTGIWGNSIDKVFPSYLNNVSSVDLDYGYITF